MLCKEQLFRTTIDMTLSSLPQELPEELLQQILAWLNARQLGASAATARCFARQVPAAAEARMERLGSAWPTLLPGETPSWALRLVETLQRRGTLWRYLIDGPKFLLHHRPSSTTLHLRAWSFDLQADVTIGREVVHSAKLAAERSSFGSVWEDPSVLHAFRLATEDERANHERASAGSPLELFVRMCAVESETVRRIGWTVRGDGVLVLPTQLSSDRALLENCRMRAFGEVAEDGFRLTRDAPPLQAFPRSSGKLTSFHGPLAHVHTLPPFPVTFPISATCAVDGDVRAEARSRALEFKERVRQALLEDGIRL